MKKSLIIVTALLLSAIYLAVPPESQRTATTAAAQPQPDSATVALGGQLYDNWMKAAEVATPAGNAPLWADQATNTRTGRDTWRCKECHGWDYKGKDGAYGKGSHFTGFPGVRSAAMTKTVAQLMAVLKGSTNTKHNFSTYLNDARLSALAAFLKEGAVIDEALYIDYSTKKPKSAVLVRGGRHFASRCVSCHGTDGKKLNFGTAAAPEYVGTIAVDNPWEFLHKVRFGNPGANMPAGVEYQWSIQSVIDTLSLAQTLPTR